MKVLGVGPAETQDPVINYSEANATCGHHLLDVPITETETEVEPDTMANDFCGESVTFIWVACWCVHKAERVIPSRGCPDLMVYLTMP
jgi:hypothetical protein